MTLVPLLDVASLVAERVGTFEGIRPYIATGSMNDEGGITPEPVTIANKPSRADLVVASGDVCFARMQGTKKVMQFDDSHSALILSTGFAVLRPNPSKLDSGFLRHWLRYAPTQAAKDSLCSGATQKAITNEKIAAMAIQLPASISEQRRIAAILDKADALRAKRRDAIAKLDQLQQSVFLDMFGSASGGGVVVADLAVHEKAIRTGPFGSQLLHSEFVDAGVAVLGIDNAVTNRFVWAKERFITEEKYAALSRYRVLPGDLLITIMGTCGRCAVAPDDIPAAINTKHLCCITLDRSRCDPEFLHSYFLMHPQARDYLRSRAKGAIMAGLNMSIIKELPVTLPSIAEQGRYVSIKVSLQRQKKRMVDHLDSLEDLLASLQHRAFSGTL